MQLPKPKTTLFSDHLPSLLPISHNITKNAPLPKPTASPFLMSQKQTTATAPIFQHEMPPLRRFFSKKYKQPHDKSRSDTASPPPPTPQPTQPPAQKPQIVRKPTTTAHTASLGIRAALQNPHPPELDLSHTTTSAPNPQTSPPTLKNPAIPSKIPSDPPMSPRPCSMPLRYKNSPTGHLPETYDGYAPMVLGWINMRLREEKKKESANGEREFWDEWRRNVRRQMEGGERAVVRLPPQQGGGERERGDSFQERQSRLLIAAGLKPL